MPEPKVRSASPTMRILAVVIFTLFCYTDIGLEMAVVPLFVHRVLGYSTAMAGFAVSLQYFATLATRTWAGSRADEVGPRGVVITGLALGVISALFLSFAGIYRGFPLLSLALVLCGRLLLGFAESWIATGAILWNIGRVGIDRTALVISWNGVCSYGGIALGAPVGMLIFAQTGLLGGMVGVGILAALLCVIGIPLALRQKNIKPMASAGSLPFLSVIRGVLPFGLALGAGSIGFGAIASCLALYYDAQHWNGAAAGLTLFGLFFVFTRFLFTRYIAKIGGINVALLSMLAEAIGLLILALCSSPFMGDLGAALTGAGFALVFPSLGVDAVAALGAANRGAALGGYSVFLDLAIGISGPVLGMIIPYYGFGALFAVSACSALAGCAICVILGRRPTRRR